jgi:hypothetical protein
MPNGLIRAGSQIVGQPKGYGIRLFRAGGCLEQVKTYLNLRLQMSLNILAHHLKSLTSPTDRPAVNPNRRMKFVSFSS